MQIPLLRSPADKKRRRDEELGLKQWMENLGKPEVPEDLLHDDSMLFSGADALDFPMAGTYTMAGDSGSHGNYSGFASGVPLVLPTDQSRGLLLAAWEAPPQDAEHGSNEQVRYNRGMEAIWLHSCLIVKSKMRIAKAPDVVVICVLTCLLIWAHLSSRTPGEDELKAMSLVPEG